MHSERPEEAFDIPEIRSREVIVPHFGVSPEEQARVNEFIREWYRTHKPVAYFCKIKENPDAKA